jgi:hypothetical protein
MTPLLTPARLAIWSTEALANPSSAIVSIAQSTICARRAVSANDRFFAGTDLVFARSYYS